MTFMVSAIRLSALRALSLNNCQVLRSSHQLPIIQTSNRLINIFGKINQDIPVVVPNRPKRPANGYNIFYQDMSPKLRAQNPGISIKEVAKAIGEQWKNLDSKIKQELTQKAKVASDQYKQDVEEWKKRLTDEQKDLYLKAIRDRKQSLAKRRLKVELKHLNFPIRSKSAFNIFMKEEVARQKGTAAHKEVFKNVVTKWKSLTPLDKTPYEEMAKIDKVRYTEELNKWKTDIAQPENKELLDKLEKLKEKSLKTNSKTNEEETETKKKKKKKTTKKAESSKTTTKPKSTKTKSKSKTSTGKAKSKPKTKSDTKKTKESKKKNTKDDKSKEEIKEGNSSDESEKENL
ncbi:transcription factor A, mitochondrial-like [Oppia nitens]|uniref:transcription factor A, mitochondrial-like n=1 Tax=Oppia nitens TaxID=1686743 RepID=UPI0023DB0FBB|nr:transcription factor A, mitochondrial-like [Oppia nitens]